MAVTVDRESLATDVLGLRTIGQLLSHLRQDDRLVVNLLIDGQEPDLARLGDVRRAPLLGRSIYIETASARETALDVLDDVQTELDEADQSKTDAIELLQQNQVGSAMEKLGRCFSTWQLAQESVLKTSQLLRADVESFDVGGHTLPVFLNEFTLQLHQIKNALVNQDYVLLSDMLQYETSETSERWRAVLSHLRKAALEIVV
jgi:hypothetical protein